MIAAGGLGRPGGGQAGRDGFEIAMAQTVEMALGDLQFSGGLGGGDGEIAEAF